MAEATNEPFAYSVELIKKACEMWADSGFVYIPSIETVKEEIANGPQ